MEDARYVARGLARHGFKAQPRQQAAYLGTDLGSGVRHARATRTQRLQKHRLMHAKVARLA
eukprot:6443847-Pyramimonas_sp.AAC.1